MAQIQPQFLVKRGAVYSVRFSVPKEYQAILGKREVLRSLGTSDLAEALRKRDDTLEEIKREVNDTINGKPKVDKKPTARLPEETTVRATGQRWLASSDGIKNATRARYRQHLESFEKISGNVDVSRINRKMALDFMDALRNGRSDRTGEHLSARSLQSYQSCLASYWRVLDHWGLVDPDMRNPFSSLMRRVAGQRKKIDTRAKQLRPVTREEAESLLRYISGNTRLKYQFEMFVTVRLLWVTGCRLNEICGRSLTDIDDRGDHIRITIPEAKTEAGKRVVMVVGKSDCELLREAVAKAGDTIPSCPENSGLLFPAIVLGGYDRRPSHHLGKALEKARKALPCDSSEWDMHSFRRTAVSAMVNAGKVVISNRVQPKEPDGFIDYSQGLPESKLEWPVKL